MNALSPAWLPTLLVTLTSVGIALSFWLADPASATSRALALGLASMGIGILLNVTLVLLSAHPVAYSGWLAVPEGISMAAFLEWLLRVRRTIPRGDFDVRGGDRALRLGQLSTGVYVLLSILYPTGRANYFLGAAGRGLNQLSHPEFWLYASPVLVTVAAGFFSTVLLARRKPDRSEVLRVFGFIAGTPFLLAGYMVPLTLSGISITIGLLFVLAGGVQYHVLQGRRGEFLSRFLSPQVAQIVGSRGLDAAMRQAHVEITVVTCDLRGFTAYAQTHPSSRVIEVLSEYYSEVGDIVSEFGGTIKDYAGDGILILIGAPLAVPDHAAVGLQMAQRIRDAGGTLTGRWSTKKGRLGIGVGVASGHVTVGVIGGASRLEYTAVGPAVNLAARLCEEADDQEVLVAPRTAELAGSSDLTQRKAPRMKGFSQMEYIHSL